MHYKQLYRFDASSVIAIIVAVTMFLASPVVATPDDDPTGQDQVAADAPPITVRFNFKGASYEAVLDYFSRVTGLPVIRETDLPGGTLDYLSPETYTVEEAMEVLNIILQARGVMLRVNDDMLYLQKLTDMQRENIPTYYGTVPSDVKPNDIVTVVRPLSNALATSMADHLKNLIAEYGSITPMQQQNALVITETAAQVRRLSGIIDELDREDAEGIVKVFKIRNAKAEDLVNALKALLSERVQKYVINAKGQQTLLEESAMPGLNITVDPRTNSIVAKGAQARIDKLAETIELLDVPDAGTSRSLRTFTLNTMTPAQATQHINRLYTSLPNDQKPTIIPLDQLGKLTIIGNLNVIQEADQLLREIDGGGLDDVDDDPTTSITVVELEHADVNGVINAVRPLLNARQQAQVRLVRGPNDQTLVISGRSIDVEAVQQLTAVFDQPAELDRQVRIIRLAHPDPQNVINRALALYDTEVDREEAEWNLSMDFDNEARSLMLIAAPVAIDRFSRLLRTAEDSIVIETETRQFPLQHARPTQLTSTMNALARQMLQPRDGTTYQAPQFEAVDQLELLIVTAQPSQFSTIESLLTTLDKPSANEYQFRAIPISVSDVAALIEKARFVYGQLTIGMDEEDAALPGVEFDSTTGNLMVTGRTSAVALFERSLSEARRLLPPDRSGRMIELRNAKAADILEPLNDLLATTMPVDAARQVPDPEIAVVERTNSLYIVAETAQHSMIERYVRQLDTVEQGELPPLRLLQVRAADAQQIASMLRRRFESRPSDQRREQPVNIDADAATNTLIVTAHQEVFTDIKDFVESINTEGELQAERETMIFPLQRARAQDLAAALERLYPQPPMPLDRRGRPMPHLQEPKEVQVSADPGTNMLIVEAPAERRAQFDALVEQLDRVELPPTAELRTYHIERGDVAQIARTLTELSRRGVMSELPADGSKPVEVTIQAEPVSRTLIVAGDTVTFTKVEEMLSDLQAVPVQRSFRIFDITGADPTELADRATRLFAEQYGDLPGIEAPTVEVDTENATLLVVAEDEAMFRFASILNELQDAIAAPPDVRLVPLEYAQASDVVTFLDELSQSHLAMVGDRSGPAPVFHAVDRTNSLLIAAQPDQHEIIRSLIRTLDIIDNQEMPPLRILQLRTADAANISTALMRQYERRAPEQRQLKPVNISADAQTNTLIVAAHPDVLPEIQAIVDDLNKNDRRNYEGREIRIFPLKVARAEELARTIDEMYPEPPMPRDSRGRPRPDLAQPREVVVRADTQTNALIVDAPIQRMAGFEELVEQLDRQKIVDETQVVTYQIVHADLDALANTIRDLAASGSLNPDGQDRRVPVNVTTEPVSQTLIVSGPTDAFARIDSIIDELDVKRTGPATELRFFKLEFARAESMANMLRDVLASRIDEAVPEAGRDLESLLNVTADRKTNTLIISAPAALMKIAEELVTQLDSATAAVGDPTIRVRPLTFADASEVSQSLTQALPQMISKATGEAIDVRLIPAAGSNAIILVGLDQDLTEVETLIEPLDARPATDSIDAKTYALDYADATTIAPLLQNLLTDQLNADPRVIMERIRRTRGQVDLSPRIRVEADARTNSIIVSGPQRTVALAESLIQQLDQAGATDQRIYATFTPQNAEPTQLAESVRRVVDSTRPSGRRATLELIPDPASGVVIVIGPQEEADDAIELLSSWDARTPVAPQLDLRIVHLNNSEAGVVAQAVNSLIRDRERWPESLRALERAGMRVAEPSVIADTDQNRLLVSAPLELVTVAQELIRELDQPRSENAATDVRVFTLTQAVAADVAEAVTNAMRTRADARPGQPVPSVTPEARTNSIVVAASPVQLDEIAAIIESLDGAIRSDQAQVRTVFLQHARAERVVPIVEQLLGDEDSISINDLPQWQRFEFMAMQRRLADESAEFRLVADQRLNAVIISGPVTALNVAEQLVSQLDIDRAAAASSTRRNVHVITLRNADATTVATNLDAILSEADEDALPPTIRVDQASNSLLVLATDAQIDSIGQIVADIDDATIAATRQMRMVPIDPGRANAAQVAETLRRMLDQNGGSTVEVITIEELLDRKEKRTGDASSAERQEQPMPGEGRDANATAAASETKLSGVTPLTSARTMLLYRRMLRLAVATVALPPYSYSEVDTQSPLEESGPQDTVEETEIVEDPPVEEPTSGPAPDTSVDDVEADLESTVDVAAGALDDVADITIAVDPDTNSLVIVGSERAIQLVTDLAQQIQNEIPASPGRVRYIPLPESADARSLSELINQTIRQLTPPGGRPGDLRRRVSIVADESGNAIVVAANDSDFETIGDLIAALSSPSSSDQMIVKSYPLETITADRARTQIEEFINAEPSANNRRRGRQATRMRDIAIRLLNGEDAFDAVVEPGRIRVSADSVSNTILVMAPPGAIEFIDQFVELIDQTPVNTQATLKLYPLEHARAEQLSRTLSGIFRSRFQSMQRNRGGSDIRPEFAADDRTNTLVVTASPEQLAEVDGLLKTLDVPLGEDVHPLRAITLQHASPSDAANLIERLIIRDNQERKSSTMIVADNNSGVLLVRADDTINEEIDAILTEIDRDSTSNFEVRTIVLERASAGAVANTLQRFFDDRAQMSSSARGRRARARQVSIIGDELSKTLLIAASDNDFAQVEELVKQFDSPQANDALQYRVFQLEHAKAVDITDTLEALISELTWNQGPSISFWGPGGFRSNQPERGTLAIRADGRLNAIIATGEGDKFELVEELIGVLDSPLGENERRTVRVHRLTAADIDIVEDVIDDLFTSQAARRRWWDDTTDESEPQIRIDRRNNALVVAAPQRVQEDIAEIIASFDAEFETGATSTEVMIVQYADARDLADTLTDFLRDRAEITGGAPSSAAIVPSRSANALVVSATAEELATVQDLVHRLDQQDPSGDRQIEIIALKEGEVAEISRIVREQFRGSDRQGIIVTPDVRTGSLIVSAPRDVFPQIESLITRLDRPPYSDVTVIRTYALEGAQASEAVRILSETLQLDSSGETSGISIQLDDQPDAEPVNVKARIVADMRSNSLIVTATEESVPVIEMLISKLDDVPAVDPVEYRIIPLKHAMAVDVSFTLRSFTRDRNDNQPEPKIDYNRVENQLIIAATADQFVQIEKIIDEIDVPSETTRTTDFVALQYARAEQVQEALAVFYGPLALEADTPQKVNTRIVADPATNSLVISSEESEWENIRALIAKLDSEEYDSALQLKVLPLVYADARSVAQAINQAFQGSLNQRGGDQPRNNRQNNNRNSGNDENRREMQDAPSVLVEAEDWVRASAEPVTNALIISASRQNQRKVADIVAELDVADYTKLPAPRIIMVRTGDPNALAESLRSIYEQQSGQRGRRSLNIVGHMPSNTVIVRAEEDEFAQIETLAEALQQQTMAQGLTVQVVTLKDAPAARVAEAIEDAYQQKAEQANQPLSIQVDPVGNNLVIASSKSLFDEISATIMQLDQLSPAAGHGIFIIDLENISPETARDVIQSIGLHQQQNNNQSTSRLVTEPIKVSLLPGRNSIVVLANPVDRDVVVGLLKSIDAEPELAENQVRIVQLRNAEADAIVDLLSNIIDPEDQQSNTALARAVQEQVRRLSVRRDGLDEGDLNLDLSKPIKLVADENMNAVVVSSTASNVGAIEELIGMFDALPITGAVTVQLFPLENIAAAQFSRIMQDLFSQGKNLAQIAGTDLQGVPGGIVGKALLESVAISVDERTNTVVVAGKEDAVAFVEVLAGRLDREMQAGWVEPRILPLKFADAETLAETIQEILVEGRTNSPQANPLQNQVVRLRTAREQGNTDDMVTSDVFQPMNRLVIRPEPQLNALVLVGTPANLETVGELVAMMDVEAASPSAAVRIYPVQNASAERIGQTVERLFDQQVQNKSLRPEDKVIIEADSRTNSLVVSTSPRSFVVLERLLEMLDTEVAPELRAIRRIELEYASADRLADLAQEMMDARLERLRETQPETADLEKATIIPDPRTNSLIIAAGNESFEVIQQLVADLDESTLSDVALVEVFTLQAGNVDRFADTIQQIMERRYADMPADTQRSQKPLVLTDPRSNSLLVAANQEDVAAIANLIERLEATPMNAAVGIHVLGLDGNARAETLAPRLQRLMRDRLQSLGEAETPSDRVTIEADLATNSLIVAANEDNLNAIQSLLDVLVSADAQGLNDVEVVALRGGVAADMVDMLEDLYVDEANRVKGQNTVRVTADERLNAVVINAPESDAREIKTLIARLDGAKPTQVTEIKYIALKSANALETVSLIENILSGRGIGRRRTGAQATVLKYLREIDGEIDDTAAEGVEVSSAIRESITLTPDIRTNTIVVSAPSESIGMIERMIRDLDESSVGAKSIRIFQLKNADALAMADILADLFNLRQGSNLLVLKPREPGDIGAGGLDAGDLGGGGGLGGTELTAVPDERQQLSVTVDSRTNSLLVSGSPTYLELVENVVNELDAVEANERDYFSYPLNNAVAADVARVVGDFVEAEQRKLIETLSDDQLGNAARILEREVTITGDEKSNTVLVSASPRYIDTVREMIRQLDVDPPQVLIQVMLAEVTLDTEDDWGVDLEFNARANGDDITGGYGLGSAFVTGMGVPNLAVASTDFNLLIRAMQAQGRLQVLSNPSVMAANNVESRIQVGEVVQLPRSTSTSDSGQVSSAVEEKELGVILEVKPSINPDGFVRMEVSPEISTLSERTTQISEEFESPIINQRKASTTVTVQDGQTVVIGGLISDRFERRKRQVPFFGDLPIVGPLFQSETESSTKTELLIVLTPYVINSPVEMQHATDFEIDRLSVPQEVKDSIRQNVLRGSGQFFDREGNPIRIKGTSEPIPTENDQNDSAEDESDNDPRREDDDNN